jgi:anthranilate synthase component 1
MLIQSYRPGALAAPLFNGEPNLIPLVRALPADLETPVSVYLRLAGQSPSFLLESVTGGEQVARYSFIGVNPSQSYLLRGRSLERRSAGGCDFLELPADANPLQLLRAELARYIPLPTPGLPRFSGGLVGYLGYDLMPFFEPSVPPIPARRPGRADAPPQAIFLLADTLVAFDHAYGRLLLIANAHLNGDEASARAEAAARLDDLEARLSVPLPSQVKRAGAPASQTLVSNMSQAQYMAAVEQAKEHIAAGDIFQVVLSQRLARQTGAAPFDIYRALRRLNPSPYMFYFDFGYLAGPQRLSLIGASPEMHVRLEPGPQPASRLACIRPLAGTRPRGQTPEADLALERQLLADPKERAEHIMLVDLARNDLGRVCQYGTVQVPALMQVERYSHVMHIVSQVEGQLRPEFDAFDLMQATFPAGTVSGAPKIRAMQIIAELENQPRGPYAGAVGYFSYHGSLDTCITIRTLLMQDQEISVQAGAGIVADSDPEREYHETLNKARALAVAIEQAEQSGQ